MIIWQTLKPELSLIIAETLTMSFWFNEVSFRDTVSAGAEPTITKVLTADAVNPLAALSLA